jgi:hypothetical protein
MNALHPTDEPRYGSNAAVSNHQHQQAPTQQLLYKDDQFMGEKLHLDF